MSNSLQGLLDREAIRETILRWSRAVDTSDWPLFQTCHTPDLDADFEVLGIPKCSGPKLGELLSASASHFEQMHHQLTNLTFHDVTENQASTSVMVTAWVRPKGGWPYELGAWYHDQLRRTADGWRISARRCQLAFSTNPDFAN